MNVETFSKIVFLFGLICCVILLFLDKKQLKKEPYSVKNCSWIQSDNLELSHLEKDKSRIWGRKILLDTIKKLYIPYRIYYGTILGSLRHNGFIDIDGDADVTILAEKNNDTWTLPNYKDIMKKGPFKEMICNRIQEIVNNLYPEYKIYIHIGAYKKKYHKIFGKDEIDWDRNYGYLCTLTIWKNTPDNIYKLNYPHVLDVGLNDINEFNKQNGKECTCYLHNEKYSGFEGVHKHCMQWYGATYMKPQNYTKDENGERVYEGGYGDANRTGKELQEQCKNEPYSEELEKTVRDNYGN
jgi:hypothetical protein